MLRKMIEFNIITYSDKTVTPMIENCLSEALKNLEQDCFDNHLEWSLVYEDFTVRRLKTDPKQEKVFWHFVSTEATYDYIVQNFDKVEPINMTMFYIDPCI